AFAPGQNQVLVVHGRRQLDLPDTGVERAVLGGIRRQLMNQQCQGRGAAIVDADILTRDDDLPSFVGRIWRKDLLDQRVQGYGTPDLTRLFAMRADELMGAG